MLIELLLATILLEINIKHDRCRRGEVEYRMENYGPSPRRKKGPLACQLWPDPWIRTQGGKMKRLTSRGA